MNSSSRRQKTISWNLKDGVMELALHHAPLNEIGTAMLDGAGELRQCIGDGQARYRGRQGKASALIIYSRLPKGFSAGADLRELYAGALLRTICGLPSAWLKACGCFSNASTTC